MMIKSGKGSGIGCIFAMILAVLIYFPFRSIWLSIYVLVAVVFFSSNISEKFLSREKTLRNFLFAVLPTIIGLLIFLGVYFLSSWFWLAFIISFIGETFLGQGARMLFFPDLESYYFNQQKKMLAGVSDISQSDSMVGDGHLPASPNAQTPYDDYRYPPAPEIKRSDEKDFDFFISYKSEDVEIARRVSDMLIANGYKVWFAEYIILLTDRQRFQEAVDDGIARSKYGIVFSNDLYAGSPHCRKELEQLLDNRNCGNGKIIEIRIRPESTTHERYPKLRNYPKFEYRGNIDEILEFIMNHSFFSITQFEKTTAEPSPKQLYVDKKLGYYLDIGGWRDSFTILKDSRYGAGGPCGVKSLNGCHVSWNLIVGKFVPGTRRSELTAESMNDRECYDFILKEIASPFMKSEMARASCRGVHLLRLGGYSQMALTYWFRGADPNYWTRRHSIVLPSSGEQIPTEFAFTFAFFGPFREYCRHAFLMDHIVNSLEWKK